MQRVVKQQLEVLLGLTPNTFALFFRAANDKATRDYFVGVKNDPEMRGVIPNSFEHIFQHISRSHDQQYLVRASYLEIYKEDIRDLLSKDQSRRLELKERPDTGVYVKVRRAAFCPGVRVQRHAQRVLFALYWTREAEVGQIAGVTHVVILVGTP